MKLPRKLLVFLLAFSLVGCLSCVSWAVTDYFAEWGDSDQWTDQQWNQANERWSQEEWDLFYEKEYQARVREEKTGLGLTELDGGINVRLNGKPLAFGDAKPYLKEGRVMIPFRIVLESMGAEVGYEKAKKEVTAKLGGKRILMTVGSKNLIVADGNTSKAYSATMEIAPVLENGSTYIPLRAVSENLDFTVIWDQEYKIANIFDPIKLADEIDRDFTIFNRAIAETAGKKDLSKAYKTVADLTAAITLYEEEKDDSASIKANLTALTQDSNLNISGSFSVDTEQFSDSLLYSLKDDVEVQTLFEELKNVPFEFIYNGEKKQYYIKSPICRLMSYPVEDDQWASDVLTDANSDDSVLLRAVALNGISAMTQNGSNLPTIGTLAAQNAASRTGRYLWGDDPYSDAFELSNFMKIFFGDENFVKSGNTYTLELSKQQLFNKIGAMQLKSSYSSLMGFYLDVTEIISDVNYQLVLKETGGVFSDYSLRGNTILQLPIPLEVSLDITGDAEKAKMDIAMKGRYVGKITLNLNKNTGVTEEALKTAPPAGEKIVLKSSL